MEQLDKLPPPAIIVFGITLAVIFAVRYLGLWSGRNGSPDRSPAAAQVAAVIVDPTALNKATAALEAQTFEMINTRKSQERIAEALGKSQERIAAALGDRIEEHGDRLKEHREEINKLTMELARQNK